MSTRLSEVRGFSDFFSEFFQVQAVPAMALLLESMQASQSSEHKQFVTPKTESRSAQGLEEDILGPGGMQQVKQMPAYNAGST